MERETNDPLNLFVDLLAERVAQKLRQQKAYSTAPENVVSAAPYLTIKEAAEVARMSVSTIRSIIRRRKLKGHRVGRRVVVKRAELEEVSGCQLNQ